MTEVGWQKFQYLANKSPSSNQFLLSSPSRDKPNRPECNIAYTVPSWRRPTPKIKVIKMYKYVISRINQNLNFHQWESSILNLLLKDQITLLLVWVILADFWLPNEIDSWNFQNLQILRFRETSRNLVSFIQILFLFYQREKIKKTCNDYTLVLD